MAQSIFEWSELKLLTFSFAPFLFKINELKRVYWKIILPWKHAMSLKPCNRKFMSHQNKNPTIHPYFFHHHHYQQQQLQTIRATESRSERGNSAVKGKRLVVEISFPTSPSKPTRHTHHHDRRQLNDTKSVDVSFFPFVFRNFL